MSDRNYISLSLFCIICLHFSNSNMVLFAIAAKEKYEFSTFFPLHPHLFHMITVCVIFFRFFINCFWWFLPEENAERHPFLFGLPLFFHNKILLTHWSLTVPLVSQNTMNGGTGEKQSINRREKSKRDMEWTNRKKCGGFHDGRIFFC